jgi:mono/diheme cytochrome c family protein
VLTRESTLHLPYLLNKRAAVILIVDLAAGLLCIAAAQTTRSVWDGIYTADQAKRGKLIYSERCFSCHGPELSGGDAVPPLTGSQFLSNWNTLTLGDLFDRIRVSMPADKPGSLSRQQNADVLAYILSFDNFPAGNSELEAQSLILKQIKFDAFKP